MKSLVSLNPFRCRMWALQDRLESHVTEDSCRTEIQSFSKHGQLLPVLGRPLRGDPDFDVELIYGTRRLFVARHVNKPLLVELREISDREGLVAMDIENRQRVDISPYERGMSYARWLRDGHFQSQDDLARTLKISSSQVSRLLKLARMPSVLVAAFGTPMEICERWGLDLMQALEDPGKRAPTLSKARAIANAAQRPPPGEVYRALLAASTSTSRVVSKSRDEVILNAAGHPLFRIRKLRKSIAVLLPVEEISAGSLQEIREALTDILERTRDQRADARASNNPLHGANA
ncbi:MAG TPA: ParB/RepB/Spo0J family partition protein [Steroidobacteraceae bacterium]